MTCGSLSDNRTFDNMTLPQIFLISALLFFLIDIEKTLNKKYYCTACRTIIERNISEQCIQENIKQFL